MSDKVVLITGAGRGIGLGAAQRFTENGWIVLIAEIDPHTGADAAQRLRDAGGRADSFAVDVGQPEELETLARTVIERYSGVDALVNNAFTPVLEMVNELDLEGWDRSMNVNLRAAWLLSKLVYPSMKARGGGAILNVISVHAWNTQHHFFPYNVTKGGLLALTKAQAVEYGGAGIRVNALAPGWVESARTPDFFNSFTDPDEARFRVFSSIPLGRMGRADEAGNAIYFLCSDAASYISGAVLVVDGGRAASEVNLTDIKKPNERPYWEATSYRRSEGSHENP